ncbi:abc transporter family protein [Dorcoceras hygrometricum]|uniref:Abc transporter family protein n=1 Tax=Dorcoceras hygrometricum TaxID=472368 RepID=A0A2Z7D0N6_9LAMI|nr:abc transporter family protein [Dorcoceras hygrometricum]
MEFGLQCPTSPLIPPRKVPLEDLIYTSCTDPIPQPAAARTPRLHQPSAVTHLFYAYVRKATNTEFNVVVLGRDLILYWLNDVAPFLALLLSTADCDDITANVIIADPSSCLLILLTSVADHNFFQSAMLMSSLLITASSIRNALTSSSLIPAFLNNSYLLDPSSPASLVHRTLQTSSVHYLYFASDQISSSRCIQIYLLFNPTADCFSSYPWNSSGELEFDVESVQPISASHRLMLALSSGDVSSTVNSSTSSFGLVGMAEFWISEEDPDFSVTSFELVEICSSLERDLLPDLFASGNTSRDGLSVVDTVSSAVGSFGLVKRGIGLRIEYPVSILRIFFRLPNPVVIP